MRIDKVVVAAFAMGIWAIALSGCQKQEAPAEQTGNASTQEVSPAQEKSYSQERPRAQEKSYPRERPATRERTYTQAKCAQCGVIETVQEITTKGQGSGLGVVGGAVVGGLLGNQVGKGNGNDVATVVGVVGGAVAGNQIEKSVRSTKSYDITVRFEDGSSSVIREANPTAWRPGDRVKVVNGAIRSND